MTERNGRGVALHPRSPERTSSRGLPLAGWEAVDTAIGRRGGDTAVGFHLADTYRPTARTERQNGNPMSADNIIDDGRRLWLIDFEYSGNNDPCYDIADLASQASLDDDRRAMLCEAYFGVADPALLARRRLHSTIADIGWAVWASIQLRVSSREIDFARIVRAFWDQARAMLDSEEFARSMHAASGGRVSD